MDSNNNPVANATMQGDWEFETSSGSVTSLGSSTGSTDGSESTTVTSKKKKANGGDTFRFLITNISLSGATYDAGVGVTSGEASVP